MIEQALWVWDCLIALTFHDISSKNLNFSERIYCTKIKLTRFYPGAEDTERVMRFDVVFFCVCVLCFLPGTMVDHNLGSRFLF